MILHDLFESRMSELDIEYQDWKNLSPVAFHSRYKMTKDQWYAKHASLVPAEGVAEGFQKFGKYDPYWVCINGNKWKRFETYEHARAVHDKLEKKLRDEGSDKKVSLLPAESELEEGNPTSDPWIVYDKSNPSKIKKFKTRDGAKAHADKHGYGYASFGYYVDHVKPQGVKEGLRDPKDNPCWKGYKPVGTKQKGGRTVPNCVPKK